VIATQDRNIAEPARSARSGHGILLVCLVAVGLVLGAAFLGPWGPRFLDMQVYRVGATALLAGDDIYHAREAVTGLPFTYPVFAAMMFVPFAAVPMWFARGAILYLSLASLVFVCWVTGREQFGWRGRPSLVRSLLIGLASVALHPVLDTLLFGQVNLLLMAAVLADVLLVRGRYRGILVGLATGIKLTPGLFIAYYLVTGQWRAARNATLTFAATVLVGLAVQPSGAWAFWTGYMFDPGRTGNFTYAGNQSLSATVARLTRDAEPSRLLTLGLGAVVVVLVLFTARRLRLRGDVLASICVTAVGALLVSPISWTHHWVWCVPALAVAVAWTRSGDGRPGGRGAWLWAAVVTAAVVFLTGPMRFLPKNDLLELRHTHPQQVIANSFALLALGFLIWAAVRTTRPVSRPTTPDPIPRQPTLTGAEENTMRAGSDIG
jgi:alpha-1,2-mannosyltransferase